MAERAMPISGWVERMLSEPMAIDPGHLPALAALTARGSLREARMRPGSEPFTMLDNGAAHIAVSGPIGWDSGFGGVAGYYYGWADWSWITDAVLEAGARQDVATILIEAHSPGGSVAGISDAVAAIVAAQEHGKRVIVAGHEWLYSAAYWFASAADEIVLTPTGMVGALGVIVPYEDSSQSFESTGVKRRLISSSPIKGLNMPGIAVTEPMVEAERLAVGQLHELFAADVMEGRGVDRATFDGWLESPKLVGERAVLAGLADRVMTFENLLDELTGGVSPPPAAGERRGAGAMATTRQLQTRAGAQAAETTTEEFTPDQLREKHPKAMAQIEEDMKKKMDEEAKAAEAKAAEAKAAEAKAAEAKAAEKAGTETKASASTPPPLPLGEAGNLAKIMESLGEKSDAAKAFAADAALESLTPAQAKAMWERMKGAGVRAGAAAAGASANPAAHAQPGAPGTAVAEYSALERELTKGGAMSRSEAARSIYKSHPQLRERMVAEANAR